MREYVKHATSSSTQGAICFVCARRYVTVSGRTKHKVIEYMPLIERKVDANLTAESDYFLGCNSKATKKLFGLDAYLSRGYGKVSESVELVDSSEEFANWQMTVSLSDETFKVLCCPEDVQCGRREKGEHAKDECCLDCEAPVCAECWVFLNAASPKLPPASLPNDMMIFYPPVSYTHLTLPTKRIV